MTLCVDTQALNTSFEVQKDIKLEEILNNHTKYYENVEDALKDEYAPLSVAVVVRSAYSNLVLEKKIGEVYPYYNTVATTHELPHKGFDLIMYLASVGVMGAVNYSRGFDEVMMKSQFNIMGLYNPLGTIVDPIIVCHVILEDSTVDQFSTYLKEGFTFVPISEMKKPFNLNAIIEQIVEVQPKGEENE